MFLVSDNNGTCNVVTDSMVVQLGENTNVNAGSDMIICSNDSTLSLNGIIYGGTSTGKWTTTGNGNFLPTDTIVTAKYKLSFADKYSTQLIFSLASTNNGKCLASKDSMIVTLISPPSADAGSDQEVCFGTKIQLSGKINNSVSGVWSTTGFGTFDLNDSILINNYNPVKQDSISGTIMFILNTADNHACKSASDTMNVHFIQPLKPDFSYTGACVNGRIDLTDLTSISKGYITSWLWNIDGGKKLNTQNASVVFDTSGIKNIQLTVQSNLGCSYSIIKPLTIYPYPKADFNFIKKCFNDTVFFIDSTIVSQGENISSRSWSFGDNSSDTIKNPKHIYAKIKLYYVQMSITTELGCSDSITKPVVIYPDPIADFSFDGITFEPNKIIYFNDKSKNADLWLWNFGDNSSESTDRAPSHSYLNEGIYKIIQSVTNLNSGCIDTASQYLTVKTNIPIYPPKVPSGFSPNNDGKNDTLYVRGGPFKTLEFKIYNKWGQLIFSTDDPTQGWNGTWKGVMQPIGIYTFTLNAVTTDGGEYHKTGDVTIIR